MDADEALSGVYSHQLSDEKMFYQDLSSFRLPPGFRGRSAVMVQIWWIAQAVLVHMSPQIMYGWRRFVLRLFGAKIGNNVRIRPSVHITFPWKVEVGDGSWIGDGVTLYSLGKIYIGRNAVVSQGSYLCGGSHDYKASDFAIHARPIVVADEAWIAAQSFLAPGVTIGRGAVVGARSLVLKDVPPGMVAMGHPAKLHGPRRRIDVPFNSALVVARPEFAK
ncbi:WcaF family extracellular polysaccharide biosynthesis acetyltransferase [Acidisoma silvae]|uniref:Colanic acid biosynthesis acetyltransferase WcaF n=1 Tax=Acidisoma silvae TaxID=2802396 RepID=A0A963YWK4_9PROT|nr:WcaF family extracellular polysaccharide biosynthesis acetyltransferase [Acidisoma silvae]MCB8878169.1 colanic acid biosynthesis acetyltransferase WcaF [Acidisoma silvae]